MTPNREVRVSQPEASETDVVLNLICFIISLKYLQPELSKIGSNGFSLESKIFFFQIYLFEDLLILIRIIFIKNSFD